MYTSRIFLGVPDRRNVGTWLARWYISGLLVGVCNNVHYIDSRLSREKRLSRITRMKWCAQYTRKKCLSPIVMYLAKLAHVFHFYSAKPERECFFGKVWANAPKGAIWKFCKMHSRSYFQNKFPPFQFLFFGCWDASRRLSRTGKKNQLIQYFAFTTPWSREKTLRTYGSY